MKKYLFIIIFIISGLFLPISDYVELNNLIIVKNIGLDCQNNIYNLYIKEIIPEKNTNNINYKYKIYQSKGKNIKEAYQNLINNTSKKIFIKDTKSIITNCHNNKNIIKYFSLNKTTIIHTKKSIKKELSKP